MLLSYHALLLAIGVMAIVSCEHRRPLSPDEAKIVGTWNRDGMDASERTTFRADGTVISDLQGAGDGHVLYRGTWRLEGNVLVTECDVRFSPYPSKSPLPKQITRIPIVEIQPDKLIREEGRPPLVRVK